MLNPHARFTSFVVGSANRLAATASRTVAEHPGAAYNPLFIYARPGLGKTHLLMAIGHSALMVDATRVVEYVTVDDLVEAWHAAVAAGEAETYRRRFTAADLVLIDDAQLLSDRRELQAELLRLIDLMAAADRQIVLASDRPPEEIQALDERLIRRFAGGLVVDIGVPDYETRLAILARRAEERQVAFESAVLAAVAEHPIGTVRELLGALNRLIAHQAVQSAPLNVADARVLLASLGHARGEPAAVPETTAEAASVASASDGGVPTDEFTDFLSDVVATMAQQIDQRRQRLTEATLRFAAAGVRTARLETLLADETLVDTTGILERFSADVDRLAAVREALAPLAPDLLNDTLLYDPDRVDEAEALLADVREAGAPLPGPSTRYTLESFTAGSTTRPVLEAIRETARTPGQGYNPLVIVGAPGTGKTHLLHALGQSLRQAGLARVAVFDGRQFVEELVAALSDGTIARWRQRVRRVDALLLDGIEHLAGKDRSQEELYLLFNVLQQSGRQMAFTAAGPPTQLEQIEPRLATRLAGGLVLELGPPDPETRRHEIEQILGASTDPDLLDYLAARPTPTLRELQLLIQRLQAAADDRGVPLTRESASLMLDGAQPPRLPRRGSGLIAMGATLRSPEKMVETWPDMAECLLEEWD